MSKVPFLELEKLRYGRDRASNIIHQLSLNIGQQERIGLVGESGCGKSTLLKLILGVIQAQSGQIHCEGEPIRIKPWRPMNHYRKLVQYIPQDPHTALPPQQTVAKLLSEPVKRLKLGTPNTQVLQRAIEQVELPHAVLTQKASELSGGQAQRVALARALIIKPKFLLADEPTSGLDLPLREQIKGLLHQVCSENHMGLLVVTHDISMVSGLCERMLVMQQGHIIEDRLTEEALRTPNNIYTQRLLEAVPTIHANTWHSPS
ncbi:ABC transporter ATP-binding protein [Marinomonas atlantica]|uniref:ABC transporter ATP-binding protein n=1 Tax=Marinomonas atlantica TaxID=1806668 RepID=UPI000832C89C|nr:ATP-binding cassette domain-containing protein [Marinomonas atlantica]